MTDLRKTAEMALEGFEKIHEGCGFVKEDFKEDKNVRSLATEVRKDCNKYMEALRQALAQPEREQYVTRVVAMHEDGTYTTEQIPLPKREWVGLTDEEVREAYCSVSGTEWAIGGMNDAGFFAELIEAKLKEKNT